MKNFSQYIKAMRVNRKMNREEFCRAFGIPMGTLACWEANKRQPTRLMAKLLKERFNQTKKTK